MKRVASIEALLKKASTDFAELKTAYSSSLHEKHVRDDLKVLIKNIFENLRSCLDYIAQDTFDTHCAGAKKPDRLYFPIRATAPEFSQAVSKDYPGLQTTAKTVYDPEHSREDRSCHQGRLSFQGDRPAGSPVCRELNSDRGQTVPGSQAAYLMANPLLQPTCNGVPPFHAAEPER